MDCSPEVIEMDDAAKCRVQEGRATRAQAHVVVPVNLPGGAGAYEQPSALAGTRTHTHALSCTLCWPSGQHIGVSRDCLLDEKAGSPCCAGSRICPHTTCGTALPKHQPHQSLTLPCTQSEGSG